MPLLLAQNLLLGSKPFPEGGLGIANNLPKWSATEGPPAYVVIRDPVPVALKALVRVRAWSSLGGTLTVSYSDTDDDELILADLL